MFFGCVFFLLQNGSFAHLASISAALCLSFVDILIVLSSPQLSHEAEDPASEDEDPASEAEDPAGQAESGFFQRPLFRSLLGMGALAVSFHRDVCTFAALVSRLISMPPDIYRTAVMVRSPFAKNNK